MTPATSALGTCGETTSDGNEVRSPTAHPEHPELPTGETIRHLADFSNEKPNTLLRGEILG